MSSYVSRPQPPRSFSAKLLEIDWLLPLLAVSIAGVGVLALYSTAGGSFDPWASRHALRAAAGLVLMMAVSVVPPQAWMRLGYPFYAVMVLLLAMVLVVGVAQLGARRWIGAGEASLQPSELMKVALVVALARYYQWLPVEKVSHPLWVALPLMMIAAPVALGVGHPVMGHAGRRRRRPAGRP